METSLEEVQSLVKQLPFLDKVRLLEFLAPLIANAAPQPTTDPSTTETNVNGTTVEYPDPLSYSVDPNREAMLREIDAYRRMHAELVQSHLNEYVSIYQGKVVDHDSDPVALHRRIKREFSDKVVLSRLVTAEPERVLNMRSPRLEQTS